MNHQHLQGRWQAEHTVYLDNRQMQGRPGFYVLTPLLLEGGGALGDPGRPSYCCLK